MDILEHPMVADSEFSKGWSPFASMNRPRPSFLHRPAKGGTFLKIRMLSAARDPAHELSDWKDRVTRLQLAPRYAVPHFRG